MEHQLMFQLHPAMWASCRFEPGALKTVAPPRCFADGETGKGVFSTSHDFFRVSICFNPKLVQDFTTIHFSSSLQFFFEVLRGLSPPLKNPQALHVSIVLQGEPFIYPNLKPDKLPFTYEEDKTANKTK
jgi:hypothetical protein